MPLMMRFLHPYSRGGTPVSVFFFFCSCSQLFLGMLPPVDLLAVHFLQAMVGHLVTYPPSLAEAWRVRGGVVAAALNPFLLGILVCTCFR